MTDTIRFGRSSRLRTTIATLFSVVAMLLLAVPGTALAQDTSVGWVRLGHLSPDAPPVDIYFATFGGPERAVIRKAGYGAVTPYSALAPGSYTVSMRPANASPGSPPVLASTIAIKPATAYSVLVFATGANSTLHGDVVTDDMTQPSGGSGRVRVVQGAANPAPVTVTADSGPTIGANLAYGTTTPYLNLPAGHWSLRLASGSTATPASVDVQAGSISTVLITQTAGGGLQAKPITDGASMQNPPKLGVETGAGGTATGGQPTWPISAALAIALAVGLTLLGRMRSRSAQR